MEVTCGNWLKENLRPSEPKDVKAALDLVAQKNSSGEQSGNNKSTPRALEVKRLASLKTIITLMTTVMESSHFSHDQIVALSLLADTFTLNELNEAFTDPDSSMQRTSVSLFFEDFFIIFSYFYLCNVDRLDIISHPSSLPTLSTPLLSTPQPLNPSNPQSLNPSVSVSTTTPHTTPPSPLPFPPPLPPTS